MEPVAVLLPRLLLVDLVSVGLRQPQEPPDGAQVLPQRAVLGARALLPPEQLAQPTLAEKTRRKSQFCGATLWGRSIIPGSLHVFGQFNSRIQILGREETWVLF